MNNDKAIEAEARKWSVTLSSGEADKVTLARFEQWRSADTRHDAAFFEIDRVWRGISSLEHLRPYARLPKAERTTGIHFQQVIQTFIDILRRPQGIATGVTALLAVIVGVFWLTPKQQGALPAASTQYQTLHAEVKNVTLNDGSIVTLGPESSLNVTYDAHMRRAVLTAGNALFVVSKNPERPFVVRTGATETRVLGTVFSVSYRQKDVRVAVKEGKVRVGHKSKTVKTHQVLRAGQSVSATLNGEVGATKTVNTNSIGTWREGRLVYEDATLRDVIMDANRYYDGVILLADNATSDLRISMAFKTDDIDRVIENLGESMSLDINRDIPSRVLLQLSP